MRESLKKWGAFKQDTLGFSDFIDKRTFLRYFKLFKLILYHLLLHYYFKHLLKFAINRLSVQFLPYTYPILKTVSFQHYKLSLLS